MPHSNRRGEPLRRRSRPPARRSGGRRLSLGSAVPILATIAVLLVCETTIHLWWGPELASADESLVQQNGRGTTLSWDPRLLWRLPRGTWTDQGVTVQVNHLGMRGPELVIPKPADQQRVLGLGDSGLFGFGVEASATYLSRAAQKAGIEPCNAGVPGYSTHQAINWLAMAGDQIEPDVLVVSNMWGDKAIQGFVDRELLATHERLQRHPIWVLNRLFEPLAIYRLIRHQVWKRRPPPPSGVLFQGQLPDDPDGSPRVPIEEYKDNLDTIAARAEAEDAKLIFLLPSVSNDLDGEFEPPDLASYRNAMRDAGEAHGAQVVETPAILRAAGRPAAALFMDGVHLTTEGHAVVGEALGTVIVEALSP